MTAAAATIGRVAIIAGMVASVAGLMALFSEAPVETREGARKSASSSAIEDMAAEWSGEIDFGVPYLALAPSGKVEEASIASGFDPADDYWGLPRTPGVEAVAGWCGACHSLALVMQQHQSAAGWERLLSSMVEVQGMPSPGPDERAALVAYLAREFGPGASVAVTQD